MKRKNNVNKLPRDVSSGEVIKDLPSQKPDKQETALSRSVTKSTKKVARSRLQSAPSVNKVRTNGLKAVYFELFQRAVQAGKFDLAIKIAKEQFPNDVSITWKGDRCFINPTRNISVAKQPVQEEPDLNEVLKKYLPELILANWRETLKRYGVEPITWPLKRHVRRLCYIAIGYEQKDIRELLGLPMEAQG